MRRLPSLVSLRAFEVASRHLSFKWAANELGLSPTAISHQVRSLEEYLGLRLFVRHVRRIELTANGKELAGVLTRTLDDIAASIERLNAAEGRDIVTVGAGPVFAARWLAPSLGAFWKACPGIDLRIHHSPLPAHQQLAQYDMAIAWGFGDWRKMTVEPLLRAQVTPVHAPRAAFIGAGIKRPESLVEMPLLHQHNYQGWRQWLEAAGVSYVESDVSGSIIEDTNVLLQAVLDGQGVGLGLLPFIADDLLSGRLVQPFDLKVEPAEAYYLIYEPRSMQRRAARDVRDWLKQHLPHSSETLSRS